MEERSFEIEDILAAEKKKKVNSSDKGKRFERELCKLLKDRFKTSFSRTIGSGNRWGQVSDMPEHAKETFTGDVVCPEGFRFALESKGGYDDIDLERALVDNNAELDGFLEQAEKEGSDKNRLPLVCWRKTRKAWLAFIRTEDLPHLNWKNRIIYGKWSVVPLAFLLLEDNKFFYEDKNGLHGSS
jgi:hypothetical protein